MIRPRVFILLDQIEREAEGENPNLGKSGDGPSVRAMACLLDDLAVLMETCSDPEVAEYDRVQAARFLLKLGISGWASTDDEDRIYMLASRPTCPECRKQSPMAWKEQSGTMGLKCGNCGKWSYPSECG